MNDQFKRPVSGFEGVPQDLLLITPRRFTKRRSCARPHPVFVIAPELPTDKNVHSRSRMTPPLPVQPCLESSFGHAART